MSKEEKIEMIKGKLAEAKEIMDDFGPDDTITVVLGTAACVVRVRCGDDHVDYGLFDKEWKTI